MTKDSLYKNLNIDKSKTKDEIVRLSKIRGLNTIDTTDSIDSFLDEYFSEDSIKNQERYLVAHNQKWAKCFAGKPIWGIKVDPLKLEPFVARYVNALNGIGAKTNSSCDGWHKDRRSELFVEFKDRYSLIWHKLMCKRLNDDNGIKWEHAGNTSTLKLPSSDEKRIEKYLRLNKNAEAFENMSDELLELKRKVLIRAKNKVKNNLSDEEAERWMASLIEEIDNGL